MYYYVSNTTSKRPFFFADTNRFFFNFPVGQRQLQPLKNRTAVTKLMLEFKKLIVQVADEGTQEKKKTVWKSQICVNTLPAPVKISARIS